MRQKFTYLFIFLFLTSVGSISLAQSVLVDFEEGGNGAAWTWAAFANAPDAPPEIIPNPDMTGANTSATVASFTALSTGDPWAGFFSDDIGEFTFDETNSTVKIMVWKPTISNVTVKFEVGSTPIEIPIPNTVTNAWEELTYDFSGQIGNTFSRLTILPDFVDGARAQDNTLYIDNLTIPEGTVAADVNVTFQVDMNVQIAKGNFDAATDVVTIPGGFNNWLNEPPANSEKTMDDSDADGIYTKTMAMAPNLTYEYKYNIGLGWDGKDELQGQPNRSVAVGTTDLTVDVVYFNNEEMPSGENATVTFNVDMEKYENTGAFDPTANNVFVAGSFTGWEGGALLMADNGADTSVYTITVDTVKSAQLIKFKFIWAPGDTVGSPAIAGTTWESISDRSLWVVDGEQTFSAFWNDEDPNAAGLADGNITFNVDMSVMSELGLFDPNTDSVQIRGGFNGWSDSEADKSKMNQDFLNPNAWFIEVPFVSSPIEGEQFHKYFVSFADTNVSNEWSDGYERPLSQGGGNRAAIFLGQPNQIEELVYYDGVLPNYVIEEEGIQITFSIDMTVAADAGQQVPTFNPATDTVWWISEQPAFVYSQGWEDTDDMRVLALTDDNSDMVYEGTLTVMAPSWNGFEYRYGFSNTGSLTREESGFGNFAYRVRYIEQDGYRSFVQPYAAPTDTWFLTENKQSEWEEGPAGDITGVEQLGLVANKFSLEQNYPNPFNPTTQIRFSIPATDIVTLKIYNLLGQEVKTLINEEMKPGTYEFNFNASNLASGLYIYKLSSGNFASNKKMLLLK